MKTETQKQKLERINLSFNEQSSESNFEQFIYITNKKRGNSISETRLLKYIEDGQVGTMLKKYDSIAYNCEN